MYLIYIRFRKENTLLSQIMVDLCDVNYEFIKRKLSACDEFNGEVDIICEDQETVDYSGYACEVNSFSLALSRWTGTKYNFKN